MCWYCQHATLSDAAAIGHVLLHLEVELVDGRLEERGGGQNGADYVRAMPSRDIGVYSGAGVLFLQLARQLRHVPSREQVVPVETGRNVFSRSYAVTSLGRNLNLRIVG